MRLRGVEKMGDEAEIRTTKEKLLFYTTAFFILLGTFSMFAFLFLVPFVIEPAFTTIFMQFEEVPALCETFSTVRRFGNKNCSWSSCREGCTKEIYECTQIKVNYRLNLHNYTDEFNMTEYHINLKEAEKEVPPVKRTDRYERAIRDYEYDEISLNDNTNHILYHFDHEHTPVAAVARPSILLSSNDRVATNAVTTVSGLNSAQSNNEQQSLQQQFPYHSKITNNQNQNQNNHNRNMSNNFNRFVRISKSNEPSEQLMIITNTEMETDAGITATASTSTDLETAIISDSDIDTDTNDEQLFTSLDVAISGGGGEADDREEEEEEDIFEEISEMNRDFLNTTYFYVGAHLYPNVKGCGYPPMLNCTIWLKRYTRIGVKFPCYYSKVDPSVVISDLDYWQNTLNLIYSMAIPIPSFIISVIYLTYAYFKIYNEDEEAAPLDKNAEDMDIDDEGVVDDSDDAALAENAAGSQIINTHDSTTGDSVVLVDGMLPNGGPTIPGSLSHPGLVTMPSSQYLTHTPGSQLTPNSDINSFGHQLKVQMVDELSRDSMDNGILSTTNSMQG